MEAELNLSDVKPEKGSQIENSLIREPYWGLYNAYYLHCETSYNKPT